MAAIRWLNWSPASQKAVVSTEDDTDKTDTTGGVSVLSVQDPGAKQTFEASGVDVNPGGRAARPELASGECKEAVSWPERIRRLGTRQLDDPIAAEAILEIAGILTVAFRRHQKIQRVPVNQLADSVNRELAISDEQSVHECGQPS